MNRFLRYSSVIPLFSASLLNLPNSVQPARDAQTAQVDHIGAQVKKQQSLSPPPWQLGPTQESASEWQLVADESKFAPEYEPIPVPQKPSNLADHSKK